MLEHLHELPPQKQSYVSGIKSRSTTSTPSDVSLKVSIVTEVQIKGVIVEIWITYMLKKNALLEPWSHSVLELP
jgi:hypothetical protein